MTAPAAGTTSALGTNIPLTATATDADGTICEVSFFADSALVGSTSSAPYSAAWSPSAAGTYFRHRCGNRRYWCDRHFDSGPSVTIGACTQQSTDRTSAPHGVGQSDTGP